jgi:hypothetical protein
MLKENESAIRPSIILYHEQSNLHFLLGQNGIEVQTIVSSRISIFTACRLFLAVSGQTFRGNPRLAGYVEIAWWLRSKVSGEYFVLTVRRSRITEVK